MYMYIYIYIYIYIYACIYTYIHIYSYIYSNTIVYSCCTFYTRTHIYTHTCTHTRRHTQKCTHACTHKMSIEKIMVFFFPKRSLSYRGFQSKELVIVQRALHFSKEPYFPAKSPTFPQRALHFRKEPCLSFRESRKQITDSLKDRHGSLRKYRALLRGNPCMKYHTHERELSVCEAKADCRRVAPGRHKVRVRMCDMA